jgi:hypothetical protein
MQPTSINLTSITPTKVLQSPIFSSLKMNCETSFQQHVFHDQSGVTLGSTPVAVSKDLPKMPQYTPQQIVAFGGIHEEASRGAR